MVGYFSYLKSITGNFFIFFEEQKKWNHNIQLPNLPLRLSNWYVGITEVLALFVGIISIISLIKFFFSKNNLNSITIDTYMYISIIVLIMIFVQGGSLHSMNR